VKQGDLDLAEQTCRDAILLVDGARIPPLGRAHIVLGIVALERNDIEAAEPLLRDGVALSRQGGLMDNAVLGFASLARLHTCQGDAAGAQVMVQEARAIIQAYGVTQVASHGPAFLARLHLFAGQIAEAARWAAEYQASRGDAAREYEDITLARVLLAARQRDAIPTLLHPIFESAALAGRRYTCIESALLLSLFYDLFNQPDLAAHWIVQAIDLAAAKGYVRVFLDEGKPLLHLLRKARASAPEFIDKLVKAMEPEPEVGLSAYDLLPEPLSEQEQRVLERIVGGKSNQEIAALLFISVGTAKWHVHNILQKLGVNNRPQAIARARELGLY
jgi:LuxR family maltose regulon positive regulatory protein